MERRRVVVSLAIAIGVALGADPARTARALAPDKPAAPASQAASKPRITLPPGAAYIAGVPSLCQFNPKLPEDGKTCCAPVAVSNSLAWLAQHGYPRLLPESPTAEERQIALVNELASRYIRLNAAGIDPAGVIKGVSAFIRDRAYRIKSFESRGRRWRPQGVAEISIPTLEWIKSRLGKRGGVWLNIGRYEYDAQRDEYQRYSGHWVTLVGCGVTPTGERDEQMLVVHDPVNKGPAKNLYAYALLLNSGTLVGKDRTLCADCAGFYRLAGTKALTNPTKKVIMLDQAVALELESPEESAPAGR